MSTFRVYSLTCGCGEKLSAPLAESVNVQRAPELREQILKGQFHRVKCPKCKRTVTVEKPFLYFDTGRQAYFNVLPASERHRYREASDALSAIAPHIPDFGDAAGERQLRAVFGMGELREKLVAQDAGIDDRIAELLKVLVISDHPFLVQKPRLRLELESATKQTMRFHASFDHNPEHFSIDLPEQVLPGLLAQAGTLQKWSDTAHGDASLFADNGNHWVNVWRFSPQPTALGQLHDCAQAIKAGMQIDTASAAFKTMVLGLPKGAHLPAPAKQDLAVLFEYAHQHDLSDLEATLFNVRYDHTLAGDWTLNKDPNDIATLYNLLSTLPVTNVEGNTSINQIFLDGTSGGMYATTTHDIHIGEGLLPPASGFARTVLHEVGHSVEDHYYAKVAPWIATRFGWQMLGVWKGSPAQWQPLIDQWVGMMGGWGAATPAERNDMRGWIVTALGRGSSWDPGPMPNPPAGHIWLSPNYGPRLAVEHTHDHWYQHAAEWFSYGGKKFFLNYWYATLGVVDETTVTVIGKMPWNYAAMSPAEFFAELYAAFFNTDHRNIAFMPQDVADWISANIGTAQPNAPLLVAPPPPTAPEARPDWYWQDRVHSRPDG